MASAWIRPADPQHTDAAGLAKYTNTNTKRQVGIGAAHGEANTPVIDKRTLEGWILLASKG